MKTFLVFRAIIGNYQLLIATLLVVGRSQRSQRSRSDLAAISQRSRPAIMIDAIEISLIQRLHVKKEVNSTPQ